MWDDKGVARIFFFGNANMGWNIFMKCTKKLNIMIVFR